MSLNWNCEAVEDFDNVCMKEDNTLSNLTETLIWAGASVGYGEITKKNYVNYHKRMAFIEAMRGVYLRTEVRGKVVDRPITINDIKKHIGLHTNWDNKSDSQWLKDFYKNELGYVRWRNLDLFTETQNKEVK
tara:strand:- start:2069 stop:2464 length:396 start_codon:yes stop_codon:yes gene_type:complete